MAKQIINVGTVAGDGTGDPIRTAFGKANANFTEVYDDIVATNIAVAAKLSPNGDGSALTGLTKAQVSLGNVDNTSDNNKPISTVQQTALNLKLDASEKGAVNGVATLVSGKIPLAQIPLSSLTQVSSVATQVAQLALTAEAGDIVVRTDLVKSYVHNGGVAGTMADWTEIVATPPVLDGTLTALAGLSWSAGSQVPAFTGIDTVSFLTIGQATGNLLDKAAGDALYASVSHTHVKADIGLANVDNTSDANKPVSTATQTALDAKSDKTKTVVSDASGAKTLALVDADKFIRFTNATSTTVSIPDNATVAFPVGTVIEFNKAHAVDNAGNVVFQPAGGVDIEMAATGTGTGFAMKQAFGLAKLIKVATDTWSLTGHVTQEV